MTTPDGEPAKNHKKTTAQKPSDETQQPVSNTTKIPADDKTAFEDICEKETKQRRRTQKRRHQPSPRSPSLSRRRQNKKIPPKTAICRTNCRRKTERIPGNKPPRTNATSEEATKQAQKQEQQRSAETNNIYDPEDANTRKDALAETKEPRYVTIQTDAGR